MTKEQRQLDAKFTKFKKNTKNMHYLYTLLLVKSYYETMPDSKFKIYSNAFEKMNVFFDRYKKHQSIEFFLDCYSSHQKWSHLLPIKRMHNPLCQVYANHFIEVKSQGGELIRTIPLPSREERFFLVSKIFKLCQELYVYFENTTLSSSSIFFPLKNFVKDVIEKGNCKDLGLILSPILTQIIINETIVGEGQR